MKHERPERNKNKEIKMESNYKVGDRVIVVTDGALYTTFENAADDMQLQNWVKGRGFELGKEPIEGKEAVVIAISKYVARDDDNNYLLGIRMLETGHEYIISERGIA